MVISRRKDKGQPYYKYYLDGRRISQDALGRICRTDITDVSLMKIFGYELNGKNPALEKKVDAINYVLKQDG